MMRRDPIFRSVRLVLLALLSATALPTGLRAEAPPPADDLIRQGLALAYSSPVAGDDTLRGIALLEEAAATGSTKAEVELGSLYLYGGAIPQDWHRARGHFETAAAAGDWSGLAQYGAMLMWREQDWQEGQRLLEQAAEQGVASAWVTLAKGAMYGYLGGGSASRAKYRSYADKAMAAGAPGIAVLEAERLQWGISVRADGDKALTVLSDAADQGDVAAAQALITLLRDGNGLNIRKDRPAARAALLAYTPLLTELERWQFDISLQAAEARGAGDYAALAEVIAPRQDWVTRDLGRQLAQANPNALVYLLQTRLQAAGQPDGFAGPKTLAAMNAACPKVAAPTVCGNSVLQPDVMAALLTLH